MKPLFYLNAEDIRQRDCILDDDGQLSKGWAHEVDETGVIRLV